MLKPQGRIAFRKTEKEKLKKVRGAYKDYEEDTDNNTGPIRAHGQKKAR